MNKSNRHDFSFWFALYAVIAEYVHATYFDWEKQGWRKELFRIFIYKPICYFGNRSWQWHWHCYADYCKRRSQFYSKPDTPYISGSKQFNRFCKDYLNKDGIIDLDLILEERPFSPVKPDYQKLRA